MDTPFTPEQFFDVFKSYNEQVFPAQIFLNLLAVVVLFLIFRPTKASNKMISILLAFFWIWMGIVYHMVFFSGINPAAYVFGVAFILQSVLFLTYGVGKNKLSFAFQNDLYGIIGCVLVLYALIIYPVIGYLMGHVYPSSPTFGLPCPTTILTFGVLLLSDKKLPMIIMIIPVLWSVIGFTAAFNFGVWEDTGLLIAGLLSLILIPTKNKKYISA